MYRVLNATLTAFLIHSCAEEVRTTDLNHAMKVAGADKTSGWIYYVQKKRLFRWKLIAAFKNGKRFDKCGCRVV